MEIFLIFCSYYRTEKLVKKIEGSFDVYRECVPSSVHTFQMPTTSKSSSSSIAPNVRRTADVKMPIRVTDGGKDQRYVHLQICKDNGARDMRTVVGFLRK